MSLLLQRLEVTIELAEYSTISCCIICNSRPLGLVRDHCTELEGTQVYSSAVQWS